jgi:hypothetical protein
MHGTPLKAKSRASPVPVAPPPIINTWVSKQLTSHEENLKQVSTTATLCNKALIESNNAMNRFVAYQGLFSFLSPLKGDLTECFTSN